VCFGGANPFQSHREIEAVFSKQKALSQTDEKKLVRKGVGLAKSTDRGDK
jgi:hypothetical protein